MRVVHYSIAHVIPRRRNACTTTAIASICKRSIVFVSPVSIIFMDSEYHPPLVPHLWFDTQAVEAVEFYTSLLPQSKIVRKDVIEDTPLGKR